MGKKVITIDLNPLSRTAQKSQITIVDNLIRCVPKMIKYARKLKNDLENNDITQKELKTLESQFDQQANLRESLLTIKNFLSQIIK